MLLSTRRRTRHIVTAALAVMVVALPACNSDNGSDNDPSGSTQIPGVTLKPTEILTVAESRQVSNVVSVGVEAPDGATLMQIGADPTFQSNEWEPVSSTKDVNVQSAGYQMIYGRFRETADSTDISAVAVVGVNIDPTYEQATSSPRVATAVGVAGRGVLQITVENGRIQHGELGTPDKLVGFMDGLDGLAGQQWTLRSRDDALVGGGLASISAVRTTRANGAGGEGDQKFFAVTHEVFVVFPQPLTNGMSYQLDAPANLIEPVIFTFDDHSTRSYSVHVNQVGFDPSDPVKHAHLSSWMGIGGGVNFGISPGFAVVAADGSEAFRSEGVLREIPEDGELGRGDLTGSSVWELDFSSVTEPGDYTICVDGIGCSETVHIAEGTWRNVAVGVARALFHQRSGSELGEPYTSIIRPTVRGEGTEVYASTYTLLQASEEDGSDPFDGLIAGATEDLVDGAWGGHFDAGDWDRRAQHLFTARALIDLVDLYPELYGDLDLDIPESGDAVPDLLDEALWTLDLFSRLQDSDGGVSGGIESSSHPLDGTTSWTDELPLYAYAPDPWSTYIYAATAAQMAVVLEPYDAARAGTFEKSALKAMEWADTATYDPAFEEDVKDQRSTAAAALFRLTGEAVWQDIFSLLSPFGSGTFENLGCHGNTICDAAWIYARTDNDLVDPDLMANVVESFRSTGENLVAAANTTAFGWSPEHPENPLIWGLGVGGAPKTVSLLRAYKVVGDPTFLETAFESSSVGLGDNPTNTVFITGFGNHPVRDPLIVDSTASNVAVWAGTPVFGAHRMGEEQAWIQNSFLVPADITPGGFDVPYLWSYFDFNFLPPMNEFSIFQSHGPAAFGFGALAGEGSV